MKTKTKVILSACALTLVPVLLYNSDYRERKPVEDLIALEPSLSPQDLRDIETADSEIKGKWAGLCPKNAIKSVDDFHALVNNDSILAEHFSSFDWDVAKIVATQQVQVATVTHRAEGKILPTAKPLVLPAGDGRITDGKRTVRTFCCNDVITPAPPVTETVIPPDIMERIVLTTPRPYLEERPLPRTWETVREYLPVLSGGQIRQEPQLMPVPVPAQTPEPMTLILMGLGLVGIAGKKLWRKK